MTNNNKQGFTILEMLIVLAVLSILLTIVALNLRVFENPLKSGITEIEGLVNQTRGRAQAQTSAIRLTFAANTNTVLVSSSKRCTSLVWTPDPSSNYKLPESVTVSSTNLSTPLCIDSRGFADQYALVQLARTNGEPGTKSIEVLRGGVVRRIEP